MGDEKVETACLDLPIQEFCCDGTERRRTWGLGSLKFSFR